MTDENKSETEVETQDIQEKYDEPRRVDSQGRRVG